jgi:RNA polymerase sigma-70 factor (ECF subfamily)
MLMMRVPENREVFGCLIERYEAKIRRYVKRIMPGLGEDVDDVLQNIFLNVYVNARGFDTTLSFSSWLYRIAHNEAVTWLRKKRTRPHTVDLGDDDLHTFRESIEESAMEQSQVITTDEVSRVLALMPEKYRSVLVLRYLEGKSYQDISDILTVPDGTVATLIHRAKQAFSNIYRTHHE